MKTGKSERLERRGSATLVAVFAILILAILSGAMLVQSIQGQSERVAAIERHKATHNADAGVAHAVTNLTAGDENDIGSSQAPLAFSGGSYWAEVDDNGDGTYTVVSTASFGNELETIEAWLTPKGGGIYDNAIFAGNSSGDPGYVMEMGGVGGQADEIYGDLYSGGSVAIEDDAFVTGTIRADGSISGASGESGVSLPIPDIASMDYENTADFDVADLFSTATYRYDNAGGYAWQMPESSPAHVFRKNPSDRQSEIGSTVKDDFFLEDPYEPVLIDPNQNGTDPYPITLSGVSGEAGPDSNHKVFYIDGNLWLHNLRTYSFGLSHSEPNGVQVTFVVKGNVYFSDNFFYADPSMDGVAFIAIEDQAVADSGNIFFGDPEFGTLQQMNAFMYAENDFYDTNLTAAGSSQIAVNGNMTAGNQVLIERNFNGNHTKLTVTFDDRISLGTLEMPGLPPQSGAGPDKFGVDYWHRIAHQ